MTSIHDVVKLVNQSKWNWHLICPFVLSQTMYQHYFLQNIFRDEVDKKKKKMAPEEKVRKPNERWCAVIKTESRRYKKSEKAWGWQSRWKRFSTNFWLLQHNLNHLSCMYTDRKSSKTGWFPDRPIVFGSLVFRPIRKSAEKLAEIKFVPNQKSAENRLKPPIRTVHKF